MDKIEGIQSGYRNKVDWFIGLKETILNDAISFINTHEPGEAQSLE
jgi:hypothetical protein